MSDPDTRHPAPHPRSYTPKHLANKILTSRAALEGERKQVTVLFADVKGSMELAEQVDPEVFHRNMERFAALLAEGVHRFEGTVTQFTRARGREVKTTGDGFFAAFVGPARAIRCAVGIREQARALGIDVRSGLHTGECERRGDGLAGIAVHIGARVAALAQAGEVLVTGTVRDLVAGSGFTFTDRGEQALKGVPPRGDCSP